MTVLRVFSIEHNRLQAAEQDYELAKEQHREVLKHRDPLNPDHEKRFRDAQERLELAREAWLKAVDDYG